MPSFRNDGCPICHCKQYKSLGKVDLGTVEIEKPADSEIVKCKQCKTMYVNPMPVWSRSDLQKLYGNTEDYFASNERWLAIRRDRILPRRCNYIEQCLQSNSRNCLEIGAGITAFMSVHLSGKGWNTTVQEPSAAFAAELRQNPSIDNVIETDFMEMPSQKYSLIFMDSVMEHVANPVEYAKKIAGMLESGGLFFFISPIEHSFTGLVKNTVKRILGKPCAYLCPYTCSFHLIGFSKKGIKLLAKESGLEVVKHVRRYDYAWLNMTEKYSVAVKMVAAPVLYFADLVGWGCNQEIVMRKRP